MDVGGRAAPRGGDPGEQRGGEDEAFAVHNS